MKKTNKNKGSKNDQIYGKVQGYRTQQTGKYTNGVPTFDLEGFDVRPFNNLEAPSTGRVENSIMDDPIAMAMFGAFGRAGKFIPKKYAANLAGEMTGGATDAASVMKTRRKPTVDSNISRQAYIDAENSGGVSPFEGMTDEYNLNPYIWKRTRQEMFPDFAAYKGSTRRGARFNSQPEDYKYVKAAGSKEQLLGSNDFYTVDEINKNAQQQRAYWDAREAYDEMNPQTGGDMIMRAFTGDRSREESFESLFPNAVPPNWREKFYHPEHMRELREPMRYNDAFRWSDPLAPEGGLKAFEQQISKGERSPSTVNNYLQRQKHTWHKTEPRDYLSEMRGSTGLSLGDIRNLSDEDVQRHVDKIHNNMLQYDKTRMMDDVFNSPSAVPSLRSFGPGKMNRNGGYLPQHKFGDFLQKNMGTIAGIGLGAAGAIIAGPAGASVGYSVGNSLGDKLVTQPYMENEMEDQMELAQRSATNKMGPANASDFVARNGGFMPTYGKGGKMRRFYDARATYAPAPVPEVGSPWNFANSPNNSFNFQGAMPLGKKSKNEMLTGGVGIEQGMQRRWDGDENAGWESYIRPTANIGYQVSNVSNKEHMRRHQGVRFDGTGVMGAQYRDGTVMPYFKGDAKLGYQFVGKHKQKNLFPYVQGQIQSDFGMSDNDYNTSNRVGVDPKIGFGVEGDIKGGFHPYAGYGYNAVKDAPYIQAGIRKTFEDGGMMGMPGEDDLIHYQGPSHEQGGIPVNEQGMPTHRGMAIAEVEGGETSLKGYVFSDTLKDKNGQTFADASKAIEARYKNRKDSVAVQSKEREMSRLMAANEELRIKKENTMMKRKMGGFLKKYRFGAYLMDDGKQAVNKFAPGGFLGMPGQDWAQFGIQNVGNILAMVDSTKPYHRTQPAQNPYAREIASGPTRLDPSNALNSNMMTYTGTKRNVPGMVNNSGQGYLAGRLMASRQKYAADAGIHNQYDNANAQLNEQYKARLLGLGTNDQNAQQYAWDANRQADAARRNQLYQSAGAMGLNFDSLMNKGMYRDLISQYQLNQQRPTGADNIANQKLIDSTEGVMRGENAYQSPQYKPWQMPMAPQSSFNPVPNYNQAAPSFFDPWETQYEVPGAPMTGSIANTEGVMRGEAPFPPMPQYNPWQLPQGQRFGGYLRRKRKGGFVYGR